MNKRKTLLSIVTIVIICFGITFYIFSTEPVAETEGATKQSAMLVEVTQAEQGTFRPIIKATGTVQPARDIILSPQISGQVVRISDQFIPGSFVKKGQLLVQIDPADYKNAVQMMESNLAFAEAQLTLEMGQQEAAKNDYQLAQGEVPVDNKALLLREPQLNAAKANVKRAEAQVSQAKLDLQRTSIRAPFDAQVVGRMVNEGSQVAQGINLGRLVGTDEYWVTLNVPQAKINWLDIPEQGEELLTNVKLTNSSWGSDQYREGALYRLIGTLTEQARFAQVLVKVKEPLGDEPPLIIGSFVEAAIPAKELKDVVRLHRDYLRRDQTVWVMGDDDKLDVRQVDVAFLDESYAYITNGLTGEDQVIVTSLSTVVEGASLRTETINQ